MKLKKWIALALTAAMSLSLLTACSRPSGNNSTSSDKPSQNQGTQNEPSDDVITIKIGHTDSSTRSTHVWSV